MRLLGGLATVVATLALLAPAAHAGLRSDPGLAHVLGPQRDGTVRGNAVTIRVRVSTRVKSFSARLGSREVGRRFARRGGRLRVARLRVGRASGLRHGLNRLEVRVRDGRGAGDYEVVRFAVVRRAPKLLRVAARRRTARHARVRLRLARKRATVRLRLNGRRVTLGEGRRLRAVRLAGDEGLRHGRNARCA